MGGSRGLMGREAFAKLRSMIDELLSKKQDKLTAGANVSIAGTTISATDTTYAAATTSKAGLMSAADKGRLDKAIKSGDELMTTNPFTPGSTLYISKIDNAFYAADKRFSVSGELTASDGTKTKLSSSELARLFSGDYEDQVVIHAGSKLVLRMSFEDLPNKKFPGYPYGRIIVSFYYVCKPKNIGMRMYNNYKSQGVGWKNLAPIDITRSSERNAFAFRNEYFGAQELELTVEGDGTNSYGYTALNQIEMHLDRPYSGRNPFLSKYAAEELYYPLTAPRFVGRLEGTADAADTASRVASAGAGTANAARHVWFSDSAVETARVHSDAFKYNPVGNLLSCNVSGNAATAGKLKTARRITFEGAASGSALFDGGGDVTVTLSSSAQAPSFLAAHPPGSIYRETTGRSPAVEWGGAWRLVDSLDGFAWLRTDSGQADNFTVAQFLAAHPVGCIFEWDKATNPGAVYGGTWVERPSMGAFLYERTA